ncbi:Protein of unknown function [Chitinophaga costaii]|uniref:DUF3037 domain-containing protein n=1 Tax=Chitinophaga costaii TaxID=1335309 RepID=A0A1C4D148_9BACT|nr:DUF3037 domain-containing protein [Chitinophaga costaii]PUZ24416.1 DUF3037 domain-containing protein [Chitinophaga costaii]SCC25006.1 Protein of unknown function [Chitinophaga costaii]
MPDKHLFEYAVIRVVPRVEREEFLNVGVILYCRQKKFLQILFTIDERRLQVFTDAPDIGELRAVLCAFEQICQGTAAGGPIGRLDIAARFRWLTATRSTIVQTSKVHPGFSIDPANTLLRLHQQLVL